MNNGRIDDIGTHEELMKRVKYIVVSTMHKTKEVLKMANNGRMPSRNRGARGNMKWMLIH